MAEEELPHGITNVKDRYRAWRADPQTTAEPSLAAAFAEGFMQAWELASGVLRQSGSMTSEELAAEWEATRG